MQADRNLCYYYAKAVPTALIPERYRSQCNVKHELTSGASVVILTMGDRSTFVKIEASASAVGARILSCGLHAEHIIATEL